MNKYLIVLFLFLTTSNVFSNDFIDAKTSILIDYNSDAVLYESDADIEIYPASMTKIMTTIVAFDLIEEGKLSLDDKFIVSENAWRMSQSGYSSMFIMVNDEVTVDELLKGIIIVSGNDACIALAEGIAGSEENFVEIMNEKAEEMGLENTNFGNSSGINSTENYSTVRDIAIMSKHLIKNYPEFYKLYSEKSYTWDRTGGDPIKQGNRNGLLYRNIGVDGIKTGYLALEKYSLASSMKKETRRLIAVGSGFKTKAQRLSESLKLLNWGYKNTDTFQISKENETIFPVKTWLGRKNTVDGVTKEDVFITLSKKDGRYLKVEIDYEGPIPAPIKQGQEIGSLKIYKKNEMIKSLPLYASLEVKKINFFKSLFVSLNYLIWGDV